MNSAPRANDLFTFCQFLFCVLFCTLTCTYSGLATKSVKAKLLLDQLCMLRGEVGIQHHHRQIYCSASLLRFNIQPTAGPLGGSDSKCFLLQVGALFSLSCVIGTETFPSPSQISSCKWRDFMSKRPKELVGMNCV